jgi:hypothetical protein
VPKRQKSPEADNTLRAFYEACGMDPKTIEGAIKQRYEKPTNFVAREKSGEAARIARARRKSRKDAAS